MTFKSNKSTARTGAEIRGAKKKVQSGKKDVKNDHEKTDLAQPKLDSEIRNT